MQENLNSKDNQIRYFLVCTVGINSHNILVFSNFDIKTQGEFPTRKRCIEISNEKFPNLTNVTLTGICEMTQEDWKQFISKKYIT